ncbi:MAG: type I methionyl aminopeptidase [Actinomycetes bacterium]
MIQIKSAAEVEKMRVAGLLVGRTLQMLAGCVRAGVSTAELDALAEAFIRDHGGLPSFKGYLGYPASICASVDDEVVHGIPSRRLLVDGEIISIDCGAIVDGWHGDAAITVAVGSVRPELARLMEVTEAAMWRGIGAARLSGRLTDVSHAVESYVRSQGSYGVVEEYVGHGIGTEMHQDPPLPNYGRPGRGPRLRKGLVLACEPMVTLGDRHTHVLADSWTVCTDDGLPAAHFEHTFTLTDSGPWALTAVDGGRAGLASVGAPCGAPEIDRAE